MSRDLIAARLAAIEAKGNGIITPDAVVADARKPSSPLHSYFEWDDSIASAAWRIEQARTLIRSVMVIVTTDKSTVRVVAYVRDPDQENGEQGYTSTVRIRSHKDRARAVMVDEFSRAAAIMRRARELAIFFSLEKETDEIVEKIERVKKMIEARV